MWDPEIDVKNSTKEENKLSEAITSNMEIKATIAPKNNEESIVKDVLIIGFNENNI